jgi:hypothetical protein
MEISPRTKRFSFLLLTFALAACQIKPTATPNPHSKQTPGLPTSASEPTFTSSPNQVLSTTPDTNAVLVSTVADIMGTWYTVSEKNNKLMIEINSDFSYAIKSVGTQKLYDNGMFTLEGSVITFTTSTACSDKPGSYKVFMYKENGKTVKLQLVLDGTDSCKHRSSSLVNILTVTAP